MIKSFVPVALIALVLMGQGCPTPGQKADVMDKMESDKMMEKDVMKEDAAMMMVDETKMMEMKEMSFDYSGEMTDVTGGNASGTVMATFSDGTYTLLGTFENLPEPEGTDFYEGWVVRRGANMSVISTGVLTKENGTYVNSYMSGDDLTDHDFYVLTIEPDDGDPAPAAHVVEGVLTKK